MKVATAFPVRSFLMCSGCTLGAILVQSVAEISGLKRELAGVGPNKKAPKRYCFRGFSVINPQKREAAENCFGAQERTR